MGIEQRESKINGVVPGGAEETEMTTMTRGEFVLSVENLFGIFCGDDGDYNFLFGEIEKLHTLGEYLRERSKYEEEYSNSGTEPSNGSRLKELEGLLVSGEVLPRSFTLFNRSSPENSEVEEGV